MLPQFSICSCLFDIWLLLVVRLGLKFVRRYCCGCVCFACLCVIGAGLRFCLFVLIVVCVLLWVLKIGLVWIVSIGLFVVLFCLLLLLRSVVDCFLVCC